MSEKNLNEADWKKFAKGKDYKDAALLKALAAVERGDKSPPDEQLKALDELEKQAEALLKLHKGDKALADQIGLVTAAAKKQHKALEIAAKAAEIAAGIDEEESPALLTTKMVPLMRLVPKGDVMQALIALAGKETAVLVSRKPIPAPRRKLLAEQLGTTSGVRYIPGECIWEKGAHTFVVQTQAGGLAKRVKAALLAQTEVRYKVRIRGEDPNDVDEDLEDEAPSAEQAEDLAAQNDALKLAFAELKKRLYPQLSATVRDGGPHKDTLVTLMGKSMPFEKAGNWAEALAIYDQIAELLGAAASGDPLESAWNTRWAALEPRLQEALADKAGDTSKLRAVSAFAQEKAEAGQFKAALQGLDSLEKLLRAASEPPAPDPGPAFTARLAALMPHVQKALAEGGDEAKQLKLKVSEAGALAKQKDYNAAHAMLDELEARFEVATERLGTGLEYWHDAWDDAVEAIREVIEAVKETGDEDAPQVEVILASIIKNLTRDPVTREQVADLKRYLMTDDVISAAEEVPARYGSLDLRAPLLAALSRLE